MNTYEIITIRDPRSPHVRWYEIEGRDSATGESWTAAVCDTRDEAEATVRAIKSSSLRKENVR